MGQPTRNSVHVDALLTNISVAYIQERSKYVATQVFPIITVDKVTFIQQIQFFTKWKLNYRKFSPI